MDNPLQVLDKTWHRGCFTCEVCKSALTLKTFKSHDKKPYCASHYPQLRPTPQAKVCTPPLSFSW